MSANICSDVTPTIGKDTIVVSDNPEKKDLKTTNDSICLPNSTGIMC